MRHTSILRGLLIYREMEKDNMSNKINIDMAFPSSCVEGTREAPSSIIKYRDKNTKGMLQQLTKILNNSDKIISGEESESPHRKCDVSTWVEVSRKHIKNVKDAMMKGDIENAVYEAIQASLRTYDIVAELYTNEVV